MLRALCFLALCTCVPPATQPSYYGQPQGQQQQGYAQQGAQPAPTGANCRDLFTCFQGCADGTCIQTCLGQADATTQAAASAYMQCGSSQCQNEGSDCLAIKCKAEMDACHSQPVVAYQQPAAQPQPVTEQLMFPDQPHTTANLLPWMTGQWIGTNHQFEFWADGRVRRASGVPMYGARTGNYQCVSTINEIGTVRQEGDLLIMEFEPAAENHCGNKNEKGAGLTVRYRISWSKYSDMPTMLDLIDIDCTKGAMYCDNRMRRR